MNIKKVVRALGAAHLAALLACSADPDSLSMPFEPKLTPEQIQFQLMSYQRPARTLSDSVLIVRAAAKGLALALADDSTRLFFWDALQHSRVREGKVQLQRFLGNRGRRVAAAMERAIGQQPGSLGRVLSQIGDLEAYLPVPEQRAAWKGTTDYLVAGEIGGDDSLRNNQIEVPAFDALGKAHLLSSQAPPATPVIAVVRAEARYGADGEEPPSAAFSSARSPAVCHPGIDPGCPGLPGGGGGGGTGGGLAPCDNRPGYAWFVCEVKVDGSYESWLNGSPEITVALRYPITDGFQIIGCLNQDEWPWFNYDNTSVPIQGGWFIGNESTIDNAIANGHHPALEIWEDDQGSKCSFEHGGSGSEAFGIAGPLVDGIGFVAQYGLYLFCAGGVIKSQSQYWMESCPYVAGMWLANTLDDDMIGRAAWPGNAQPGQSVDIYRAKEINGSYIMEKHGYVRIRNGSL